MRIPPWLLPGESRDRQGHAGQSSSRPRRRGLRTRLRRALPDTTRGVWWTCGDSHRMCFHRRACPPSCWKSATQLGFIVRFLYSKPSGSWRHFFGRVRRPSIVRPHALLPLSLGSALVWVWEATQTTRRGGFLADDRVYRARDVQCRIMSYWTINTGFSCVMRTVLGSRACSPRLWRDCLDPFEPLAQAAFREHDGNADVDPASGTNGFAKKRRPQFTWTTHRERSSREGPILIDTVPLQLFDFQQFLSD